MLFPPDQVANLYLGPLEFSSGTPVSMVDARAPDLTRFPRFAAAMTVDQCAAWRAMIDHVVFDDAGAPAHLPADRHGNHGGIGEAARTKLCRRPGALMSR